jgi:hypothetical protein
MIGMRRQNGVAEAINLLRPGAQFSCYDNDYDQLTWYSPDIPMPTRKEVETAILSLEKAEPLRVAREIRDWYLQQSDWTQGHDIRAARGKTWCQSWDAYRQALRDISTVSTPFFDDFGVVSGVVWPEQPPKNGGSLVPDVVTPLQMRKALRHLSLKDSVDAYLASLPEEAVEEWEYATEIHRDNPFIESARLALNMSEAEADELFALAATM